MISTKTKPKTCLTESAFARLEEARGLRVIRFNEDVDDRNAERLRSILIQDIQNGTFRFSFDFSRVTSISETGYDVLKTLPGVVMREAEKSQLEMIHAGKELKQEFSRRKLDRFYRITG